MTESLRPVFYDYGQQIGIVQKVYPRSSKATFGEARALDGAGLGSHPDRGRAQNLIRGGWMLGRLRHPKTGAKDRPVHTGLDAGIQPIYLGR